MQKKHLLGIASLLFVSVLGIFGYLLYASHQENKQLASQIASLQAQMDSMNPNNPFAFHLPPNVPAQNPPTSPQAPSGSQHFHNSMAQFDAIREKVKKQMQNLMKGDGFDSFFNDDFFKGFSAQKFLNTQPGSHSLHYDIQEKDDQYVIEFSTPAQDDLNLNIRVQDGNLVVKEEKSNQTSKQAQNNYFNTKTFSLSSMSIPLPKDAGSDFKTKVGDGKFLVILPKAT